MQSKAVAHKNTLLQSLDAIMSLWEKYNVYNKNVQAMQRGSIKAIFMQHSK